MRELKEGEYYDFTVCGELTLSENENYFILSDPFGKKHLLNKKYYELHKLTVGKIIKCRVDRINCQGRIYIEPEHPYYKIGVIYPFEFIRKGKKRNKKGEWVNILFFKDFFNNEAESNVTNEVFETFNFKNVKGLVTKIKKSKIYISVIQQNLI